MRVDAFDYELPEELIALRPLERREDARLLCVTHSDLKDCHIRDLPDILQAGDLVVVNNTKVIPAFLRAMRPPRAIGGNTQPVAIDLTLLHCCGGTVWEALAKPAKRLRQNDLLFASGGQRLVVEDLKGEGKILIRFDGTPGEIGALLVDHGQMPLPPYISSRRAIDAKDRNDYQTVFAKAEGAVAAPTAGLHMTRDLFAQFRERKIDVAEVTLHVGLGTFLPVKVDETDNHVMHAEWGEVSLKAAEAINRTRQSGGRVLAVGTTSLRLLETAAQADGTIAPFAGETSIFIVPGYDFKTADLLLTNFHLPRSTLLMMVSAFSGQDRIKHTYCHGIAAKYRFYSYGDACLLERPDRPCV